MVEVATKSPSRGVVEKAIVDELDEMDFFSALRQVIDGRKVTKGEWDTREVYGVLKDSVLMLHKAGGTFHQWIISEGDLTGKDWKVF